MYKTVGESVAEALALKPLVANANHCEVVIAPVFTALKSVTDRLEGSNIHVAIVVPGAIDTEIWDKDETPSAYKGRRHPVRIVTAAIMEAIEKRRHEIIVPKRSPQLVTARLLRFFAPSLLRAGMAWEEPVPAEVVEGARTRARERLSRAAQRPARGQ